MDLTFKGTPRPWEVLKEDGDYCYSVINPPYKPREGTEFICSEIQQGYDDGESDARLIAAAPDLLEACIYYMEHYQPEFDSQLMFAKFQQAVHKALNIKE